MYYTRPEHTQRMTYTHEKTSSAANRCREKCMVRVEQAFIYSQFIMDPIRSSRVYYHWIQIRIKIHTMYTILMLYKR